MAETSLVPVIVGGLLAMGGGAITGGITLIVNHLQASTEKKKRRADKFEELVAALYEFDHWIDHCRMRTVHGEDIPQSVSPFAKMQSISSVYFSQFDDAIKELSIATGAYRLWMTEAGLKRLAGDLAHVNDGFQDAYNPYSEKREALLDALKKFAREEFQ